MIDSNEFLDNLCESMELPSGSLRLEDELSQLGQWDSLAILRFIAMVDANYGRRITGTSLRACKTIGDLKRLAEGT